MAINRHSIVAGVVVGLMCLVGTSVSNAAGGVYLDEVQVKNDGRVVFSENFDDGNISDWYQLTAATLITTKQSPSARTLHMNKHDERYGMARHKLSISPVGIAEFGAWVFVAPAQEQYEWQQKRSSTLYMTLEFAADGGNVNKIRLDIEMLASEKSCRIRARQDSPGSAKFDVTKTPVLPTGKWAYALLRVDSKAQKATAFLDNAQMATIPYDPAIFRSIVGFTLNTGFGDGAQMTEKP